MFDLASRTGEGESGEWRRLTIVLGRILVQYKMFRNG